MPFAITDDGVRLHYEETGTGTPVLFIHEFAGDHRSWEAQVRALSGRYRCIVYSARGYPPSDVPDGLERYSQARARDDARCVLDHLGIERAHVVGLSMGGFATLHFGLRYPDRARALVVAGCGYGAAPSDRERFRASCEALAARLETLGMAEGGREYAAGPARVQLQNKDPKAWALFAERFAAGSAKGRAFTMRGVQMRRPSLWDLVEDMKRLRLPVLVVTGDEDEACIEPGLLMKRSIPASGLLVFPRSGHMLNLEEPALFNRALLDFFGRAEQGRWSGRGRADDRDVQPPPGRPGRGASASR